MVRGVDYGGLCDLAMRYGCVLELLVRIGEYVPDGGAVVTAYGPPPPTRAVLAGLHLGRNRTLYQDPAFGFRELIDIAIQALSPAVNQPTTAIQVIDRLEDILIRIALRATPTGLFADEAGTVRFMAPAPTWDEFLELAVSEITSYGAGSAQVARRLLATYDALEPVASEQSRAGLRERRAALLAESARRGVAPGTLRADAMGLG